MKVISTQGLTAIRRDGGGNYSTTIYGWAVTPTEKMEQEALARRREQNRIKVARFRARQKKVK